MRRKTPKHRDRMDKRNIDCKSYILTPTSNAREVCMTVQFSKQVSASRSWTGWLTVCSRRAEWPEHFMCKPAVVWLISYVMKKSWQPDSSYSNCSPTLPGPQANAPIQMPAQATGRSDKTHQITLPFWMVPTLYCHRCMIPSHQMLIVIGKDKQLSMAACMNGC